MKTRLALALCLAVAAPFAATPAYAQSKDPPSAAKADEASQRFKSGVAFYKDKDFTAAMVEFKKAYELLPNYVVLYNIAQTARELKDYAAALTAYQKYLDDGGAKVQAARRKEVQATIDELKNKVGKLKIVINVEGAEIAIDDAPVGAAPLADPIVVNVGRHKLSATSSGYTPAQRVIDVAGLAESTVTLELVKIGVTPPPSDTPSAPSAPVNNGPPLVVWVTLSATAATAVITAVTGGLAISARSSLKNELASYPGDAKAIAEAQSRTRTFAVTADVMGGLTVAGAAATGLLFALLPRGGPKPNVGVSITPNGASISGSF